MAATGTAPSNLENVPSDPAGVLNDTEDMDCEELMYKEPRMLLVVRHADRMDYEYGNQWIDNVTEDPEGMYKLALPFTDPVEYDDVDIPKRAGGLAAFRGDTPITPNGHQAAQQVGGDMKRRNIDISHVYSSPALRCVQTAHGILTGLQKKLPIHVEPGLFELLSLRPIPTFMTLSELTNHGLPVEEDQGGGGVIWPESAYKAEETREEFYDRSHVVTQAIVDRLEGEGGNILLVGHAASLDTCVRKLLGKKRASNREFYKSLNSEYCEVRLIQEVMKLQQGKRVWQARNYYCK